MYQATSLQSQYTCTQLLLNKQNIFLWPYVKYYDKMHYEAVVQLH